MLNADQAQVRVVSVLVAPVSGVVPLVLVLLAGLRVAEQVIVAQGQGTGRLDDPMDLPARGCASPPMPRLINSTVRLRMSYAP